MPQPVLKLTGLKKRQQIENAGRSMFLWVAIAAVAVSICIVMGQFLFQKWSYNNRVLSAKYEAADTLKRNITNAQELQDSVNALVSNADLGAVKTNPNDPNTKSVLDALPSKLDATALATSLQQAILAKSGVTVENITVPTDSVDEAADSHTGTADAQPQEMQFDLSVSGPYEKLRAMILDLERTIRPMKITSISLRGDDAAMTATFTVVTYYQPSKTVDLKSEVIQ